MPTDIRHAEVAGTSIAYRFRPGRSPALLFLPGYASDMEGTKAVALDTFAEAQGLAMLRFDYSGTGSSGGSFEEGTLGGWLDEALHMLDNFVDGPAVIVGSSMGGWLALLIARRRPERVAAVVGIAAAPDFTDWGYSDEEKQVLRDNGRLEQPNPYAPEPQVTTCAFWQSGQGLRLLDEPIPVDCPVRFVHGDSDSDVPVDVAMRTMRQLRSADVQLTVIKGGGHRLSERHEIEAILRTVNSFVEKSRS
jgi:pimeloyl-ACP methyl ester carboxylesterase